MTTQELYSKYPKLFPLMKDSYFSISTDIPEGWMKLVDLLCNSIQRYIDLNNVQQVEVTQIKEKYGKLRFYFNGGDTLIEGMVEFAEEVSGTICEHCGKEGTHREIRSWWTTICDKCVGEEDERLLKLNNNE